MSSDAGNIHKVFVQTHNGGVCVNDTLMHIVAEDAPFGGTEQSGRGALSSRKRLQNIFKGRTLLVSSSDLPKNKIMIKYRGRIRPLLRAILLR
jgi:coniferyl-aldehyde dehydrogenase